MINCGEWPRVKLGDVVSTVTGSTPSTKNPEFYGEHILFVKPPDLIDSCILSASDSLSELGASAGRLVPKGSVLVSCIGNLGKIGLATQSISFNQQINAIVADEKFDPKFMFYQAMSPDFKLQLEKLSSGTTVSIVNKSKFNSIKIVLPPLRIQKRIVAVLDEAFADIDKARELTEQNLKNTRELFESYLHQAFFPESHWETNTLSNICQIKPPKKEARDALSNTDKVSFVPMDCLGSSQKEIQLKHERILAEVAGSYTYFGENDVLLAKITPCFENGKLGIARGLTNRIGFGSSEFIVFRCSDKIAPDYLYYYLSRQRFIEEGQPLMTGAVGHKRVSKDFIENYSISYPPLSEQKQICGRLDKARTEINRIVAIYETKLDYLNELRNSLLANTFSGKLKIA